MIKSIDQYRKAVLEFSGRKVRDNKKRGVTVYFGMQYKSEKQRKNSQLPKSKEKQQKTKKRIRVIIRCRKITTRGYSEDKKIFENFYKLK